MFPKIAIIDHNTLAAIGLKSMLQHVMPIMQIDIYGSFVELEANHPETYYHYFVALDIVLQHKQFFLDFRHKTIVLSLSLEGDNIASGFHSICINQSEKQLIKSLLALEQSAHAHGRNHPQTPSEYAGRVLSDREVEVMVLIVQGYINKEIADKLNISLSTVITHRKNIMGKLGIKSVSALTIYAVTRGFVDINNI